MARLRVPHTLILLCSMIVLALVLAYLLPQGSFQRESNDSGREQVVPGTYQVADQPVSLSPLIVFTAIPRGFEAAQEIIFFVFLVGGAFGVLRATGAIDALIGVLLKNLGNRPFLLVAGATALFAVGSSTIGMAEEYLPFVPVLLALAIGLGFDAITAIGILCVGYGVGFGVATINPFTVIIAQQVAGLTPTSGAPFRLLLMVVFLTVGIHHVWRYASRVKAKPESSLVADLPLAPGAEAKEHPAMNSSHLLSLGITVVAIAIIVYGLWEGSGWHWYVKEMGAMFLGLSLALTLVARLNPDHAAKEFCTGAAELATTALLIGFARSILIVLEDGQVIDTIIHGISQPLGSIGAYGAAAGMFFFQSLCNLFIPSGSGQAYVTMPIMAPLADLVGIQRQVAVLAYQFGDGFTNILVPTNPVLIGILTMAGIPYDRWLRFILPFMVKIWIVGSIMLAVAVMVGVS